MGYAPTPLAIVAFWVSGVIALNIGSRGSRKAREVPKWVGVKQRPPEGGLQEACSKTDGAR
jgi:hypothetical protein